MKVDENGWKWIQISAGLLASLMPFMCHLHFSALSDYCRVIGYFGQLFITIHTKTIEHHFLKMDVYHKINPSILWPQSSDWLLIVTFITKGSFPPDQLLLDIFPPQYIGHFCLHTIAWNNDSVKVSITNRKGKVRLHAARRLKVPEAEKIYRIYSDACLMSMSQGAGCLWVKGVTAKVRTNLKVAFWRKSLFWPISTQRTSPSVIHRWKAMDPCYDM